jgi:hypothetical protein
MDSVRQTWAQGGRLLVVLRLTLVGVVTAALTLAIYVKVVGVANGGTAPAPVASGDMRDILSGRPGIRVLFIGNSLTYENSLDKMVHEFAAHDRDAVPIFTYRYAPGGAWLSQAAASAEVRRLLTSVPWSDIVLQEDSHVSDYPAWVDEATIPSGRELEQHMPRDARPVVFETWGYRNGHGYPFDSYGKMQERAQYTALRLQRALGADLAPVGYVFSQALKARPDLSLWLPDSVHPSRAGTYLAAAVFFDVLDRREPTASTYNGGLDPGLARWLREQAQVSVARAEPDGPSRVRLPTIRDDPWSYTSGGQ